MVVKGITIPCGGLAAGALAAPAGVAAWFDDVPGWAPWEGGATAAGGSPGVSSAGSEGGGATTTVGTEIDGSAMGSTVGVGSGSGPGSTTKVTAAKRINCVMVRRIAVTSITPRPRSRAGLRAAPVVIHYQRSIRPSLVAPRQTFQTPSMLPRDDWGHGARPRGAARFHATRHPASVLRGSETAQRRGRRP